MRRKWLIILSSSVILFWMLDFHWTNPHEAAIRRNIVTGELSLDTVPGAEITYPWVQVAKIDLRPRRLCIECDCKNINCVLVSFDTKGWKEFVQREGFRYWWLSNRISYNSGAIKEYRGMDWILRSYAFDNAQYPFLSIESEMKLNPNENE